MEEKQYISTELHTILDSADWKTLGKKMLARAIWRGSTRYKITSKTIFARGYSVEDIVSYIIVSVYEGTRKWEHEKIELEEWLMNQVDSVMDWILKLVENKEMTFDETDSIDQDENPEKGSIKSVEIETALNFGPPNPEMELLKTIDENKAKEMMNSLYDSLSDEPDLQELLLTIIDLEDAKPSVVADKMAVPVKEINNLKKRLNRHKEKFLKTYNEGSHEY